ncbi:transcription termination/antitermination protein NusG [Roseomonas sp. F4]
MRQPFRRWIVIHHRSDDGARVRIGVRREGFEVHWPREVFRQPRRDDRLRPFLPGYMFAYPVLGNASWHRVKAKVPNVIGIVGVRERGEPVSPPPGFVEALIDRCGGILTGAIPLPEEAAEAPLKGGVAFVPGAAVRIAEGPLAGLRALFQADRGPQRIMVLLTLLGVPRMVEVDREAVEAE